MSNKIYMVEGLMTVRKTYAVEAESEEAAIEKMIEFAPNIMGDEGCPDEYTVVDEEYGVVDQCDLVEFAKKGQRIDVK